MRTLLALLVLVFLTSSLEAQALFGKKKEPKKEELIKVEEVKTEEPKLAEEKKLETKKTEALVKTEAKKPEPVLEKVDPDEARKNALSEAFDSIENDDWDIALKNIQDYKKYVETEKEKNPKLDLEEYLDMAYVFEKYVEGGLVMDGDDPKPPLDKAKNSYILAQKKVDELEKSNKDEFILIYIEEMQYLIEDEIDYIQEVKESLVKK